MDVPPLEFPENDIDKLVDCLGKKFGAISTQNRSNQKASQIYGCNQANQARLLFAKGV